MESRAGGLRAHSPCGRHPHSRLSLHRRFVQVQKPKPTLHVRFGRVGKSRPKSPHTLCAGAETKADPPCTLRARGEIMAESSPMLRAGAETKADHLHIRFGRVGKQQLSLHTPLVQVGRSKRETSSSERKYKVHPNRDCTPAGLDRKSVV